MPAVDHDPLAVHRNRIERLRRLEGILPPPGTLQEHCLDVSRLLQILGDAYGKGAPDARRRACQRDLKILAEDGRIEAVNPGGKPLLYRRLAKNVSDDALIWQYTLTQVRDLIAEAVPKGRLDRLWERLLRETEAPLLDEQRLRVVPDTLRLRHAELSHDVLQAVITALAERCPLEIDYRDANEVRGQARIHPQALVQRGPIPYLFALKNDEDTPLRLYALHRMIRAAVVGDTPVRELEGFDLDRAIAEGRADFGQGQVIDLELRVRGYIAEVLRVCPLGDNQLLQDEPEGSHFELRIQVSTPSTGQLLRWLLGAGANVEVIAPAELRHVVAVQTAKAAAIYRTDAPEQP
ncbi:MAG: WYL domain-containing protein [Thiohalocapsa sp.]|jgi:predicted DNA-binding transcriptional regulator YafY|nr:WYL domain-containing protein [Thiohalocapsa sp.]MCF7992776.1 WYL domain-containing protein [Thiohalocapsa sp.]